MMNTNYSQYTLKKTLRQEFQNEVDTLMEESKFNGTIIKVEDELIIGEDESNQNDKIPNLAGALMEGFGDNPQFIKTIKLEKECDCGDHRQSQVSRKRIKTTEDEQLNETISTMQQSLSLLRKEILDLKSITSTLNTSVKQQGLELKTTIKNVMHKMEEQQKILQDISFKCSESNALPSLDFFPLQSIEQLCQAEEDLDNHRRSDIINYMKSILGHHPVSRCFSVMFSADFLLEINWDGSRKKHALNRFRMFNTFLYEAFRRESLTYEKYERDMKNGFKTAKNKVYKSHYRQKLLQHTLEEQNHLEDSDPH